MLAEAEAGSGMLGEVGQVGRVGGKWNAPV